MGYFSIERNGSDYFLYCVKDIEGLFSGQVFFESVLNVVDFLNGFDLDPIYISSISNYLSEDKVYKFEDLQKKSIKE
jgi:hypothetical protein